MCCSGLTEWFIADVKSDCEEVLAEQKHYVMNPNDFVLFYHRVLVEKVQSFLDCVIINLYGLDIYIHFDRFKSVICG